MSSSIALKVCPLSLVYLAKEMKQRYHSSDNISKASVELKSLASNPSDRVNTKKFLKELLPEIEAALEQGHTFDAIASVLGKTLGYSISSSTIRRYYSEFNSSSVRRRERSNSRRNVTSVRKQNHSIRRSPPKRPSQQNPSLVDDKPTVANSPPESPGDRDEGTPEGSQLTNSDVSTAITDEICDRNKDIDFHEADEGDRERVEEPPKAKGLNNGQKMDVSHLFYTSYFEEDKA